ncbi:hypothetical protein KN815_06725 [Streptomyces sp. 4503]|uniref:Uncharacterized protein n=1 Tax=Streptomyces niphimycinicus TaxID=2842201 RepID=A0ABS6CA60_9ACTN|nr:hypothetical protein [Streptomyces niphimycinicus]MBU3863786.1 hypothetical protein [Streptomyces niphimycinicus]
MEQADVVVKRLMRNLRLLSGCDDLLTAMEGGPLVAEIMALTARTAQQTADDARTMLLTLRQEGGGSDRGGDH